MEIHLRKDNKRSRRWSSQWQSRDSRCADFEYSTIAAVYLSEAQRSFCLIWCQITRPWSKFTIRLFFAPFRPMPSPRHIVVYIAPKTPNQRKTKQNKTKKIGTNSTRIIGFYLDSSHTSKVYTHTQRWEKKGKGSAFTRRHIGECKCLPRTLQRPERERLKTLLCAHSSSCVTTHTHTHRFFLKKYSILLDL